MDWTWLQANTSEIVGRTGEHVVLSLLPVLIGLVLALPAGYLVSRSGRAAGAWLAVLGLLYAIPSIAMFVLMPMILGTRMLDPANVVAALSVYAFALLVRNVSDGFRAVDETVRQSAVAMGYGPVRRVLGVELPLAMPVIFSGLRVATVSNISLVSVGAVIGMGALGEYFTQGFDQGFATPIVIAMVLILVLALVADGLILFLQRVFLPWFGLRAR
ncbi:ABC transporter permease [Naumannella sp. ID2617S]|uniref:ABC transporter permease n=1 Tax=Enemella dayhoffiae TaxID=2016507 RepID=A0A255GT05_9ACTN|nr:ABC transporter permease [Naumannella sp. ID2617S]OYO18731.1 ABC transporter permease [Enemella dayhoffiae]